MSGRLWFKIGDAAQQVGVSPKDLRYWEQIIPEIRPRRSQGNLRYYHRDDLPRLMKIQAWIQEGLTVADCRELLRTGQLARGLGLDLEPEEAPVAAPAQGPRSPRGRSLVRIRVALRALHARLCAPPPQS